MKNADWHMKEMVDYAMEYYELKSDDTARRNYGKKLKRIIQTSVRENKDYWIENKKIDSNISNGIAPKNKKNDVSPYTMTEANAKLFIRTSNDLQKYFFEKLILAQQEAASKKGDPLKDLAVEYFQKKNDEYNKAELESYDAFMESYHEESQNDSDSYNDIIKEFEKYKFVIWCICNGEIDDFLKLNGIDSDKFWKDYDKLSNTCCDKNGGPVTFEGDYAKLLYQLKHPDAYYPLSKKDKEAYLKQRKKKKISLHWVPFG